MTMHDMVRKMAAMECDLDDQESVTNAIRGLQSTDDPSLLLLHDELMTRLNYLKGTRTCRELYNQNTGFCGFIASWKKDKRCPLPLVDYLMEQEGIGQGAIQAARWAATEPKRSRFEYIASRKRHPYPEKDVGFFWWYRNTCASLRNSREIPGKHFYTSCTKEDAKTIEEALIWLLDNWIYKGDR